MKVQEKKFIIEVTEDEARAIVNAMHNEAADAGKLIDEVIQNGGKDKNGVYMNVDERRADMYFYKRIRNEFAELVGVRYCGRDA